MNASEENPKEIQRILVAIDGSPHSLAALKLAAEFASKIEAELVGLYVEDINLLRLAELPFTHEVGFYSARVREVEIHYLKRQLRAQARRAEHALALVAESVEVQWSFHIVQGTIPTELLAAASDADLLILGKAGWSRRRQLGSTTKTIVLRFDRQLLIFQSGVQLGHPILIVYDGSDESKKALDIALKLRHQDTLLTVLIPAGDSETMQALQSEVQEWAQQHDLHPQYRWLTTVDESTIANQVWSTGSGMMILPASSTLLPSQNLLDLLNKVNCAVYLVR